MNLIIKARKKEGLQHIVMKGKTPLKYIELDILTLEKPGKFPIDTGDQEWVGIIFGGRCSIESREFEWPNIGERVDVFSGRATGFYLPCRTKAVLTTKGDFSLGIARSASKKEAKPVLVRPNEVRVRVFGAYNWRREVHEVIGLGVEAERLVVGETFNPPGKWSSWPPHRHEKDDPPYEAEMEEVYHFKIHPPQGFGFQRVYTDDRSLDEAYVLEDGDTVVIPRGYHPIAATPGYQLYYLWVLAGKKRILKPKDDPAHAWVKACEPIIRDLEK